MPSDDSSVDLSSDLSDDSGKENEGKDPETMKLVLDCAYWY